MSVDAPEHEHEEHDEARCFHKGLRLFNEGDWFEAHEVWEDVWHMASGPRKRFYQGLIQCAVTLEHIRRGNPRGVRSVYQTAVPKFDGLPSVYMGIRIPKLLDGLRRVVEPVLNLPAEVFDPARPRGQTLPFNPSSVIKIELEYDPFSSQTPGQVHETPPRKISPETPPQVPTPTHATPNRKTPY